MKKLTARTTTFALFGLVTGLGGAPACGNLDYPPPVDTIAYDQDGALIAFTASGIHLFDSMLHTEMKAIPFDGLPITSAVDQYRYALSADGHTAAVSFPSQQAEEPSTIAVFDLTTGAKPFTFHPDDPAPSGRAQGVRDLKMSPQGDLLYSCSIDADPSISPADLGYRFTVFVVATGQPLWTRAVPSIWQMPVFSQDGTVLFIQSEAPLRLEALDARTGASRFAVDVPGRLWALTMTADGKLAGYVGPPDDKSCPAPGSCPPSTLFWSPADGTLLDERPGVPGTDTHSASPVAGAAFWCSPWTDLCATDLIDFKNPPTQYPMLTLWRTDGTPVQTLSLGTGTNVVAFSPDGKLIAAAGYVGSADATQVFRIEDGKRVGALTYRWDLL